MAPQHAVDAQGKPLRSLCANIRDNKDNARIPAQHGNAAYVAAKLT